MLSAWESLQLATIELVRATPIKQRLVAAYRRHLVAIPADQLPNEVRDTFNRAMKLLSGVEPQRGEDAVVASVRKMSNQEADACAVNLVEVFGTTCKVLLNAARARAAVVQLHAAEREPCAEMGEEISDYDVPALLGGR
jgi:hypothetical protein